MRPIAPADSLRTCFFEDDPGLPLPRRSLAEAVGTLFLVLAATGGSLALRQALAGTPGLALPLLALVIAGALVSQIVAFGAVSGGHFNPLITGLQWLGGERTSACTAAYAVAQIGGALGGVVLGNLLWPFPSGHPAMAPLSVTAFASELAASAALMLVIFGCIRSRKAETGPFAVGAWLVAAVVATPTTSYSNPAIALAAILARGPLALAPVTALGFVGAQVSGALIAFAVTRTLFPAQGEIP
jgi:glycerol uptake facilitator-like aquaporin